MKKLIFLLLYLLTVSCEIVGQPSPSVVAASVTNHNVNPFIVMDLINLHSNDASKFTLVGGTKISTWTETINTTTWNQTTDANRPLLTSSIPTFDGSNDQLIRASDVSATTFSLYIVFRNTGSLGKILLGAQSTSDYFYHETDSDIHLDISAVPKVRWEAGIYKNRYSILSIRRNGSSFIAKVNDRTLLEQSNSYSAGQSTLIARLMTYQSGGFFMAGGLQALCMSSQYLSDGANTNVINSLYSECNLASLITSDFLCTFGDSNTTGSGGSVSYAAGVASSLGVGILNLGISGSFLTNVGAHANNGYDRWQSQIVSRPYTDYISIQYGTNDILGSVSASIYGTQLGEIVGGLITAGYDPSKICISSVPYQRDGANATALDNYRSQILTIVSTYGVKYFDLLQYMRDNGGNSLLNAADPVHLTTAAQTAWGNGVYTALTTP